MQLTIGFSPGVSIGPNTLYFTFTLPYLFPLSFHLVYPLRSTQQINPLWKRTSVCRLNYLLRIGRMVPDKYNRYQAHTFFIQVGLRIS